MGDKLPPRILVLSVGGSCAPVVNACREYRPDFIYFFCSGGPKGSTVAVDGEGDPCGDSRTIKCPKCKTEIPLGNPKGESIVRQLQLPPGSYEKVEVDDPDDLASCYRKLIELENRIRERFGPDAEVIANYTGGTKTMSVALALLAALREGWDLSVNIGPRFDLIKVRGGDHAVFADKQVVAAELYRSQAAEFLRSYAYDTADKVLSQLTTRYQLSSDLRDRFLRIRRLCQAFYAWDVFDHRKALELLRLVGGEKVAPYIEAALGLAGEKKKVTGYEPVMDLLLNAERRAEQGRYDDAVARLYRALEMTAQVRLRQAWNLDTGNLALDRLPPELRDKYLPWQDEKGRIRLGLVKSFELLAELNDPVGQLWRQQEPKMRNALEARNSSILAHGTVPLSEASYRQYGSVIEGFIEEVFQLTGVRLPRRQLPREELLDM
ncbi:TIGR02710 family CRISPR-associated CARF protein [Ammonifex degensii]|uniref:TIGR02710 family CRISPR-associated CARF protein n=1 Tax=Ammonifex degensii TaxID=42838 RepID=UPI0009FCAEE8|nr:TIGR02710 family CRISPR-associated CARF protein [Ammonifex degensii]